MTLLYKKNDIIELTITSYTNEGMGIGRDNNFTWFVADAVIGDVIKARILKIKANYGYAKIEEFIKQSKDRIYPICDVYKTCGGCQLQNISYHKQLEYKSQKVVSLIEKIGKCIRDSYTLEQIVGMENPLRYRNKAIIPCGFDGNDIVCGFYRKNSHDIIPFTDCLIGIEENKDIIDTVIKFIKQNNISTYDEQIHKGLIRKIFIRKGFITNEIMIGIIINGNTVPNINELVNELVKNHNIKTVVLNINTKKTNVILGEQSEVIYGDGFIYDYIGDIKFRISIESFYQVNPVQTLKLYNKALEYAEINDDTVIDLYCGIGTISLLAAKKAKKVYGIEVVERAIIDARYNAKINSINNVEFYTGEVEKLLPKLVSTFDKVDVAIVDPPRKGCDKLCLNSIIDNNINKLVYVSCDPATLARDIEYLNKSGYTLKKVAVFDMFPYTCHVESVVLMSKVAPTK